MGKLIKPLAVIATLGASAFAIPALANADVEIQSVAENKVLVSYDLKEKSTEAGRAEIERQVRRAADQVCGPRTTREAGSFTEAKHNRECFKNAVADAMRTVSSSSGTVAAVTSN